MNVIFLTEWHLQSFCWDWSFMSFVYVLISKILGTVNMRLKAVTLNFVWWSVWLLTTLLSTNSTGWKLLSSRVASLCCSRLCLLIRHPLNLIGTSPNPLLSTTYYRYFGTYSYLIVLYMTSLCPPPKLMTTNKKCIRNTWKKSS